MKLQALQRLETAIVSGSLARVSAHQIKTAFGNHDQKLFIEAFHGSYKAVKALHAATLGDGNISTPGYHVCIWMSGKASVWDVISGDAHHAEIPGPEHHEAAPMRAWLLCIVRALIARAAQ